MKLQAVYNKLMEENKSDVLDLFFELLMSEKIEYLDINEAYIMYLSLIKKNQQTIINGLSVPLMQYWQTPNIKPERQKIFIRCKAAYNLLKSKVFNTAEIEKDLQKVVDDNKYSEDENGFHKIN